MFLDCTIRRNPRLIEAAFDLHRRGRILPDSYVLDFDAILDNAAAIKRAADVQGLSLYAMTKQIGRNPLIAAELVKLGFAGIVAVDFNDALAMMNAGVKLAHVGHLVQVPRGLFTQVIKYGVSRVTVYSIEKAREIAEIARDLGKTQSIMVRVWDDDSLIYEGQHGGVKLCELEGFGEEVQKLDGVRLEGVTAFPAFIYDKERGETVATPNAALVIKARDMLTEMGFDINEVNMPSANALNSLKLAASLGATHVEPGHALTGTTPFNAYHECDEIPALVYVSEVSHNQNSHAYCYGGGHYRRSEIKNALVGENVISARKVEISAPSMESIDYYFRLSERATISETVVAAFRTQIFTTRSRVVLLSGVNSGKTEILGVFNAQGQRL